MKKLYDILEKHVSKFSEIPEMSYYFSSDNKNLVVSKEQVIKTFNFSCKYFQ